MRTLTSTLLAAQKANARKPAILAVLYPRPQQIANPRKLVWTRYYTGSENDDPVAAAVATDGSLVRLRANGTTIEHSRVTTPGSGSTYSSWTTLSAGQTDGPVALAAGPSGELCALWTRSSGTILRTATSTDNGATWSAPADVLTEGAAIDSIAATFHNGSLSTPGDISAFYVTADDAKRLARTSGSWAGSGTSWTHGSLVTTLTGIAATFDGADAHLAFTGTDADGNPRVWAAIFGVEDLPANLWGTPIVVQEADALSSVAFDNPTMDYSANGSFLAYTLTESGDVAAVRTFLTSPGEAAFNASGFFEPWPAQPGSASGAALCRDATNNTWLVQSSGVWYAPFPDAVDVTAQLLALDVRFAPEATRATVELDETAAIAGLTGFVGGSLHLGLGLETSSGTEYGNSTNLHVESIERTVASGRRFATLHCSGPWEAARATRAQQTWQRAAGEMTRAQLFSYFARRARVLVSDEGDTDWTTIEPAFAWQAGETVATALKRVLSVAEEAVRADEGYFHVITPPSASARTTTAPQTTPSPLSPSPPPRRRPTGRACRVSTATPTPSTSTRSTPTARASTSSAPLRPTPTPRRPTTPSPRSTARPSSRPPAACGRRPTSDKRCSTSSPSTTPTWATPTTASSGSATSSRARFARHASTSRSTLQACKPALPSATQED